MKFVSYMLYVLLLIMFRSYAHEREIFVKNASFWSWLYHLLICPFLSCLRCLCSNCDYLACLCLNFSMLSCSLYIWEAHACILRLDSCITNKGEESTQFLSPGGVLNQGKKNREKCICSGGAWGSLHLCIWELFFAWILVVLFCRWCRALLPHLEESTILEHFISVVSSRFPCLRGPRFFSLKWSFLGFCLAFDLLLELFLSFLFFFLFSLNWLLVCVVNALIKGEIEDRSFRGPVDGRSWLWWVIDNVVWTDSWSSIEVQVAAWLALVQVKSGRERSMPCGASEEWRDK
jgi:hypothetical protein